MIYQKILMEEKPYHLHLGELKGFMEHRHADIEFNYCVKGYFDIEIEKKRYRVREGEMSVVGSMVSHGFPSGACGENLVLTAVLGPSLLGREFGVFSGATFPSPVLDLSDPKYLPLREAILETVERYHGSTATDRLIRTGNLYKISAHLLGAIGEGADREHAKTDLRVVGKIEAALELIHYSYKEPLTVDDAAAVTGYGKSNFCKVFRGVTGESFHASLNRRRVGVASGLLSETDMPIAAVAQEVGFSEAKTFCRVFKSETGVTPGTYRRENGKRA